MLLPDGRRVKLLASGGVVAEAGAALTYSQTGDSTRVVPLVSRFLSGAVDSGLFDLQKLAAVEASSKGDVPLAVSYTGARPSLPGLTWTSANAGYVTPASASTFGKTLRTSTAAGVTRIALPGPVAVKPLYVMHTVKFVIKAPGQDNASFNINNVDDVNKWKADIEYYPGQDTRFSLPDGHYAATGIFGDPTGTDEDVRLIVVPFTVSGDTTVTLDSQTATAPVTVSTPRPATLGFTGYQVNVLDAAGHAAVFGTYNVGQGRVFVSPTAAASLKMRVQASFHLESDQKAAAPYTYDLVYQANSISKNEQFVASPGSLAAVNANFYSDGVEENAGFTLLPALRGPLNGDSAGGSGLQFPVTLGSSRTQYVSAGIYFSPVVVTDDQPGGGTLYGPYQSFRAGSRPRLDFLRGPLHPGDARPVKPTWTDTNPFDAPTCVLCRKDDSFLFGLNPLADSGGNAGTGEDSDSHIVWTLSADGTQIATDTGDLGLGTGVAVDPELTDYSLHYVDARPTAGTATRSDTTWTFSSGTNTGTAIGTKSNLVGCFDPYVGNYTTGCRTQDLLTTDYKLPEDLNDSEAVGPTSAQISVRQITGAAAHPIRVFSAQVSFDAGVTWQSTTPAASGHGTYQVIYDNPKGATAASLRVYARDSAGSTITQTIDHAYTVRGAGSS